MNARNIDAEQQIAVRRLRLRIVVLLATHNGMPYLPDQLDDILGQLGDIRVVASDDGSSDGTWEYLRERAASEPRLTLLPRGAPSGSAAGNFYRLLRDADLRDADAIAFSDQDDRWMRDKLIRELTAMRGGFEGVSSDVVAFNETGLLVYVKKSYRQRRFDWLLESSGPGSTFVMSPALVERVRTALNGEFASRIDYHDWLVYAVARASGMPWKIMSRATVEYRQHGSNVIGVNRGSRAARSRLRLIKNAWHRDQAVLLTKLGQELASSDTERAELARLEQLMTRRDPVARVQLALKAGQLRRRPREQWIIALLVLLGVW